MRAGRLVTLLLLLERRGRLTAAELAAELEVSERTVLRDVEELSGAGVPVFAVRGPGGGYELLEGTGTALAEPGTWRPMDRGAGRVRRATVRVTPDGRRLAAVLGRLQPLRVRRSAAPDVAGRVEATFRLGAFEGAVLDLCSLGPDIEVLAPEDLRRAVATRLAAAASQYVTDVARQDAEGRAETGAPNECSGRGARSSHDDIDWSCSGPGGTRCQGSSGMNVASTQSSAAAGL